MFQEKVLELEDAITTHENEKIEANKKIASLEKKTLLGNSLLLLALVSGLAILFLLSQSEGKSMSHNDYMLIICLAAVSVSASLLAYFSKSECANKIKSLESTVDLLTNSIAYKTKEIEQTKTAEKRNNYLSSELLETNNKASELASYIPGWLSGINDDLNDARDAFNENLYAPFWDNIEQAMSSIDSYYDCVDGLRELVEYYTECTVEYRPREGEIISFPVNLKVVSAFNKITELEAKMQDIIRPAQSNIDFASIYEMRRTNQILVAGFQNLSSAISGLGNTLSEQLSLLNNEIYSLGGVIDSSSKVISDSISEASHVQNDLLARNNQLQKDILYEVNEIRTK